MTGTNTLSDGDLDVQNNPTSIGDINLVYSIVVETIVDTSTSTTIRQNIYGMSRDGLLLRQATLDPVGGNYWCTANVYRNDGRLIEKRMPSSYTAVTSSNIASFLDPFYGSSWHDSGLYGSGQIFVYEYDDRGWCTGTRVKNSPSVSNSDAYYVSATDYAVDATSTTAGNWEVLARYEYPTQTTTRSAGAKTSYAYTYQDTGKNLPDTITITAPEEANSTNGPGTGNANL